MKQFLVVFTCMMALSAFFSMKVEAGDNNRQAIGNRTLSLSIYSEN